MAMFSKGTAPSPTFTCTACDRSGHQTEKCWSVVGFPSWHPLAQNGGRGRAQNPRGRKGRWTRGRGGRGGKSTSNVQQISDSISNPPYTLTSTQIEQLMKLLPSTSKTAPSDTDEELDIPYAGMVTCYHVDHEPSLWIIDSGASDHMTGDLKLLHKPVPMQHHSTINLLNGHSSHISHIGHVQLQNSLTLQNVLYVPDFKHNLLSVQQLSKENHC